MSTEIQKLNGPILARWLSGYYQMKPFRGGTEFIVETDARSGIIKIYEADQYIPIDIMELIVYEKDCDYPLYYLHFELRNMRGAIENIQDFRDYLYERSNQTLPETTQLRVKNIAVCCSSGWTSTHFAKQLQKHLQQNQIPVRVTAGSYYGMEKLVRENDLILLAPQIAYLLPELEKNYGKKFGLINTRDFATQNYSAVLHQLGESKISRSGLVG
ncbi:MAG: hypothetical protein LUE16_09750 [Lachnospiraceae bacterium]|nr:hypothetical protein [Lachnospiraceae bacterium]